MDAKLNWVAENNSRWVGMLGKHPIATIIHLREPAGCWIWSESLTRIGAFETTYSFDDAQAAAETNISAWLEKAGLNRDHAF